MWSLSARRSAWSLLRANPHRRRFLHVLSPRSLAHNAPIPCLVLEAETPEEIRAVSVTSRQLRAEAGLFTTDLVSLSAGHALHGAPASMAEKRAIGSDGIMPRAKSVVLRMSHINCVIQHDRCLVFDVQRPIVRRFTSWLSAQLSSSVAAADVAEAQDARISLVRSFSDVTRHDDDDDGAADHALTAAAAAATSAAADSTLVFADMMIDPHTSRFELRVLHLVLAAVRDKYDARLGMYEQVINERLAAQQAAMDHGIGSSHATATEPGELAEMLSLMSALSAFETASETTVATLKELLTNDDDMLAMLLSEREARDGALPPMEQHEQVELLLEHHVAGLHLMTRQAFGLRKRIQAAQGLMELHLDHNRNRLIRTNIALQILTCSLAVPTIVAGQFGMNLTSGMEEGPPAVFWGVVAGSLAVAALGAGGGLWYTLYSSFFSFSGGRQRRGGIGGTTATLNEVAALAKILEQLGDMQGHVPELSPSWHKQQQRIADEERGDGEDGDGGGVDTSFTRDSFAALVLRNFEVELSDKDLDLIFRIYAKTPGSEGRVMYHNEVMRLICEHQARYHVYTAP